MLAFIPYENIESNKHSKDDWDKGLFKKVYTSIFDDDDDIFYDSKEEIDPNEALEEIFEDSYQIANPKKLETSLCNLCYGELFVLGSIWLNTLKTVLVRNPFKLLPVVKATAPPKPPERPPKMKYQELPLYKSPHSDYKEHMNEKEKCPAAKTKLLHSYLLPHVKHYRKEAQSQICKYKCVANKTFKDVYCGVECAKVEVKKCMRDPDNLLIRQGLVAGSIITGLLMGSTIPRKLFYSGLGGLAAGSLCFPKETEEVFRSFLHHSNRAFVGMYKKYCSKDMQLKDNICPNDVPKEPPKRKPTCPKKC